VLCAWSNLKRYNGYNNHDNNKALLVAGVSRGENEEEILSEVREREESYV